MIRQIKRLIYKSVSQENYLRLLQRSYFALYKSGLLRYSDNYNYHYFVKKLIKKGDVVLDIGANLGYYSMLFAKWVGPAGKVYAVEPIALYNKIYREAAAKYKNITLYSYALGLEEKKIELVSSPQTGYLSTGLPHVYDAQTDGELENAEFRFEAQMKIPSQLFAPLSKIDYIKCDVEGFEYIVLADMKALIDAHLPIVQVEVWGNNEEKVLNLFTGLGYAAYKLKDNRLRLQQAGEVDIAGDFVFIHPSRKIDAMLFAK